MELCGGDEAAVRATIEAFRKTGRNFLTPEPSKALEADSFIDISHESLIRQWTKLSAWLDAEAQDAQLWRRLADAAADKRKGAGGLLRGQNLQTLVYWRNHSRPTAKWAGRYGAKAEEFLEAINFLERSRYAQWVRRATFTFGILAACAILGGAFWIASRTELARRHDALAHLAQQQANENERLRIEKEAAGQAKEAADRDRKKSDQLFRASSQLFITTAQHRGNGWEESGAFIASLIDAMPDQDLARILKPLQGRMVAQYAFRPSQDELGGAELRTDTRGNYRLLLTGQRVAVIDARTRAVRHEFDLSEFDPVDQFARHSISPDGSQALMIVTKAQTPDDGGGIRPPESGLVLAIRQSDVRSRSVQAADNVARPDSLVVDWNNRRAMWSQWRDRVPEIAMMGFGHPEFDRTGRGKLWTELKCKTILDIERSTDNNSLAKPFDKYETCPKRAEKLRDAKLNGAFSLISFIDKLAIIKIRIIEEFVLEPVSKLVAIDIQSGVARTLTGRESKLIASRNMAEDMPSLARRSLSAVVTRTPRGRCADMNERRVGSPAPGGEFEVCLSFIDNTLGIPLDSPDIPSPHSTTVSRHTNLSWNRRMIPFGCVREISREHGP